ncbi:MAG: RHS repeat-associated core domain-containing protein [Bacteroidota bacterium]
MKRTKIQLSLIGLLLLVTFKSLLGQAELFTDRLTATPFSVSTVLEVVDDKADQAATYPGVNDPEYIHNRLVWNLYPNTNGDIPLGEYRLLVDISYWLVGDDVTQAAPQSQLKELIIDVDSTSVGRPHSFLSFGGAQKIAVEIQIVTLDTVPINAATSPEMELIGEIAIERRLCDLNCAQTLTPAEVQNLITTDGSFLGAAVPPVDCADEYDLEWTFFDEDSEVGMAISQGTGSSILIDDLFRHNGSRMTSTGTFFRLYSLYRDGYLLVRWRAVQYKGNRRLYTGWSSSGETLGSNYTQVGHETSRNWQATTNFAEEAKQLPTINFLDGTLRNRQSLVLQYYNERENGDPHDEYAVSQQPIYDAMGRPAATTLPAPITQAVDINGLPDVVRHPLAFNVNDLVLTADNSDLYGQEELETAICSTLAPAMGDAAGAGRYYSSNNALLTRNAFVPDGEGYPFSVTRFTDDNTGRIRQQGGVGLTLQAGGEHDTRYYYGKPNQWELDRLFGVNVGWAKHYEMHLVVDPNGQSSVSYLDSKGRVIATALAGPDPSNLEPLASETTVQFNRPEIEISILDNVMTDDGSLITTYSLLVPTPTQYNICYGLQAAAACIDCPNDTPFCDDCEYDVVIGIAPVDACSQLSGSEFADPREVIYSRLTMIGNAADCFTNIDSDQSDSLFNLNLTLGEYRIYKELRLSEAAVEESWQAFQAEENCLRTEEDFIQEFVDNIDYSVCENSCDCSLPYYELTDSCQSFCQPLSACEVIKSQLEGDLRPGGQYATYELTTVGGQAQYSANNTDHPLSIFNPDIYLAGTGPYYQSVNYGSSMVMIDGVARSPSSLNIEEFVTHWNDDWLEYLLAFHPEHCLLTWCENELDNVPTGYSISSNEFDLELRAVERYSVAVSRNLIHSSLISNFVDATLSNNHLLEGDPYTSITANANGLVAGLEAYDVSTAEGTIGDVLDLVRFYMEDQYGTGWTFANAPDYQQDEAWRIYRNFYLVEKAKLQQLQQATHCDSATENIHSNNWRCLQQPLCTNFSCIPLEGFCATPFTNKVARVPNNFRLETLTGLGASGNNPLPLDEVVLNAGYDAAIQANCETACVGYRPVWRNMLAECNQLDTLEIVTILDEFEAICEAGCAEGNFWGASSVTTNPGTLTHLSFAEVVDSFLTSNDCSDLSCNPFRINFPPPSGQVLYGGTVTIPAAEVPAFLVRNKDWLRDRLVDTLAACPCDPLPPGASRPAFRCDTIQLIQGLNQISFDVSLSGQSLDSVFASILDSLVQVSTFDNSLGNLTYIPGNGSANTLNEIVDGAGYVATVDTVVTLVVCGNAIDVNYRLPLGIGLNTVGYVPQAPIDVEDYFTALLPDDLLQVQIFDNGSKVYVPGNGSANTLSTIENGKGYTVIVDSTYQSPIQLSDCVIQRIADYNRLDFAEVEATILLLQNFLNHGIESADFALSDLLLPAELIPDLEVCADCDEINTLRNAFKILNPCTSTDDPNFFIQEAAYFNAQLGWDRTADEYTGFLDNCGASDSSTCIICADPPPNQLVEQLSCEDILIQEATEQAMLAYISYLDVAESDFKRRYREQCYTNAEESFQYRYKPYEYHYTLYYYDQAGNLVMTVPPEGVHPLTDQSLETTIASYRAAILDNAPPAMPAPILPPHDMLTHYRHNNFNEVAVRDIPDAEPESSWYDPLGRIALSRDGLQATPDGTYGTETVNNTFSYTLYDELGRVEEVGELINAQAVNDIDDFVDAAQSDQLEALLSNPSLVSGRRFVTKTYYNSESSFTITAFSNGQQNLRNRVANVTFEKLYTSNTTDYDFASHYSYDAVGNVDFLVQEFQELAGTGHQFKTIEYDFDFISGNVHTVYYQRGKSDQFTYHYEYDKTNRLSAVYTSEHETEHPHSALWKRDASYTYYDHGPLRRMIYGQDRLQGMDYAYTIQGWIKGLNGRLGGDWRLYFPSTTKMDMNNDGRPADQLTVDQVDYVDLYSYGNDYFSGDYLPIGISLMSGNPQSTLMQSDEELFNGNIARHTYLSLNDSYRSHHIKASYDQLNRLVDATTGLALTNPWSRHPTIPTTWDVQSSYTYDGNGNILDLDRSGRIRMPDMTNETEDNNLVYTYEAGTNLLTQVSGSVNSSGNGFAPYEQIDRAQNYQYDEAGNLFYEFNNQAGSDYNTNIRWTPYGKVEHVWGTGGDAYQWALFAYGPDQNRWSKMLASPAFPTESTYRYEYLVRDAQGNVLATYARHTGTWGYNFSDLEYQEQYLYGSARLGQVNFNRIIPPAEGNNGPTPGPNEELSPTEEFANNFGTRFYELTNHLGNVTAVFTEDLTTYDHVFRISGDPYSFTAPRLQRYREYLPFGLELEATENAANAGPGLYRYGFNGKENDESGEWGSSTHYDYGFRIYNPTIAKFLSVDPLAPDYPWYTPYQFAGNTPVQAIDLDGLEEFYVTRWYENGRLYSRVVLEVVQVDEFSDSGTTALRGQYTDRERRVQYTTTELDGSVTVSYASSLAEHEREALNRITAEEFIVNKKDRRTLKAGYYETTTSTLFTIPPPPPPLPVEPEPVDNPEPEVITPTPNPMTTPPPNRVPPITFRGGGFYHPNQQDRWARAFDIAQWLVQNPNYDIIITSDAMAGSDPLLGNLFINFNSRIPGGGGVTYGQRLDNLLQSYLNDILIQGRNGFGVNIDPNRIQTRRGSPRNSRVSTRGVLSN